VGVAGLLLLAFTFAGCSDEPALLTQAKKTTLVHELRHRLLESAEAEKSAVLATTDEESAAFAAESKGSAAELRRLREALGGLVTAGGRAVEIEALAVFDRAWTAVETIDARILELAVANTNLKAVRLSVGDGTAALDRFTAALGEMEESSSDATTLRDLSAAGVAALRIQTLLLQHIPSADDGEMTALERRMDELGQRVDRVLAEHATGPSVLEGAGIATEAWAAYRRIAAEVIRLSRQNTNVISFDLAVHEKREATKVALAALAALGAAIESVPHPTR